MERKPVNTYKIITGSAPVVEVYRVPSVELASNGKSGGDNHTVRLHVSTDGDLWLIFTTDDGDMAIGWIDHWKIEFLETNAEWFESFENIPEYKEWLSSLVKAAVGTETSS